MYRQHTLEPIPGLLVYLAQDTVRLAELWRTIATELLVCALPAPPPASAPSSPRSVVRRPSVSMTVSWTLQQLKRLSTSSLTARTRLSHCNIPQHWG